MNSTGFSDRAVQVAVIILDMPVGNPVAPVTLPRGTYVAAGIPPSSVADVVATAISAAVGLPVTGDEVIEATKVLASDVPTVELREIAES